MVTECMCVVFGNQNGISAAACLADAFWQGLRHAKYQSNEGIWRILPGAPPFGGKGGSLAEFTAQQIAMNGNRLNGKALSVSRMDERMDVIRAYFTGRPGAVGQVDCQVDYVRRMPCLFACCAVPCRKL